MINIIKEIIIIIEVVLNKYNIPVNNITTQLTYLIILLISIIPTFLIFDFILRKVERKLKKN